MTNKPSNNKFHSQIVYLLQSEKNEVVRSVNQIMVLTYFEIGKMIATGMTLSIEVPEILNLINLYDHE
jgi:hypothetical protein